MLLSLETEVKILVVLSWKLALEGKCGKQDLERDEKEVESSEEDGTSSVPGCPERLSGLVGIGLLRREAGKRWKLQWGPCREGHGSGSTTGWSMAFWG